MLFVARLSWRLRASRAVRSRGRRFPSTVSSREIRQFRQPCHTMSRGIRASVTIVEPVLRGRRCGYPPTGTQVSTLVHQIISEESEAPVAQKIQTFFIDDLDGSEAEGTVRFALDGAAYEIDLNAQHAQALRDALAPYVKAARRAGGGARQSARNGGRKASASGLNSTEVREWAKAQGIEVKERGRIPAELVVKFKAANEK